MVDNNWRICIFIGGKKKKKKRKIPNTPKKTKHTKKKLKLHILKLFVLTRKKIHIASSCPNTSCKKSCFLSNHYNRKSCGRCGFTLIKQNEIKK